MTSEAQSDWLVVMRLKLQKQSVLKFFSRITPIAKRLLEMIPLAKASGIICEYANVVGGEAGFIPVVSNDFVSKIIN